jgi:hypothetical protein
VAEGVAAAAALPRPFVDNLNGMLFTILESDLNRQAWKFLYLNIPLSLGLRFLKIIRRSFSLA